ncbi:AprI/Inh family metalloprotease inhibitor [Rhizobium jaguaris]|uniref:AprI/Inh family metalloprotease inhibitor n=1 Tax=Rhizobium jaguaris TaxID=1312183 RepID=UPI0039BF288F
MIRSFSLAAASAALILATGQPAGAVDDELIKAQAGTWLLAPESGAKGCHLTFETSPAAGGYAINGADACAAALPAFVKAAAWNFGEDGSLALTDATQKVVARFQQEEEGSPWEIEEGDPMWLLPALGDVDHVPTIASVAGTWQIQQPDGKAICSVTLSSDTDPDGTSKMSPGSDCPADIGNLKLSLWVMEGFGLVMMGTDGSSLSFDMRPDGSFQKSEEEEGQPMVLVRKQGG